MANITRYLEDILSARYGEEVRGSIHDAIKAMNNEIEDVGVDELIDARRGANGTNYTSAGNAIRGQYKELNDLIYSDRNSSEFTPKPFGRYRPKSTPFDIWKDLPEMSYYRGLPETFTGFEDFEWLETLNKTYTYRIIRIYDTMLVYSPASYELYFGTLSSTNQQYWVKLGIEDSKDSEDDIAVEVRTNFEYVDGDKYYSGLDLIDNPSPSTTLIRATKLIPCRPSTRYYFRISKYGTKQTSVVFFDRCKKPLSYKYYNDYTTYNYKNADGTGTVSGGSYVEMGYFNTPPKACYMAWNWSSSEERRSRFAFSNIPLFWKGGQQPDLIIKKDDYRLKKKDKVLSVIGPSGVMIDRLSRSGDNYSDYISGFQEYLMPYYKEVRSYGYSDMPYATGVENKDSIYTYITKGYGGISAVNFNDVDEVLIIQSSVQIANIDIGDPGTVSNASTPGDTKTLIGAIKGLAQYILGQNPKCKIYIASTYKNSNGVDNANKVGQYHEKLITLCDNFGMTYINLWEETPFNYTNYTKDHLIYTYDGNHANDEGNRAIGDVLLKHMI